MSFFTCRCDLPQKEQRSCSLVSVDRAINSSYRCSMTWSMMPYSFACSALMK